MESAGVSNGRARLNFGWEGPTTWHNCGVNLKRVAAIELTFDGAATQIGVDLPVNINPDTPKSLRFTCLKPSTTEGKDENSERTKTNPDVLSVTLQRMRTLRVTAIFYTYELFTLPICIDALTHEKIIPVSLRQQDKSVSLEIPQNLVAGKLYQLVVSSNGHLLSARFVEQASHQSENKDST